MHVSLEEFWVNGVGTTMVRALEGWPVCFSEDGSLLRGVDIEVNMELTFQISVGHIDCPSLREGGVR